MNRLSLTLGLVTTVLFGSAAWAGDAVVPDESRLAGVENANACDLYGVGFVLVPGTGSCVRISGQVRYDQNLFGNRRSTPHDGGTTMSIETRGNPW